MEFEARTNGTIVDLLDRVLERGLVLDADLIISLGGVPLIGLSLRLALAGIDKMLEYGIWKDWPAAQSISYDGNNQDIIAIAPKLDELTVCSSVSSDRERVLRN